MNSDIATRRVVVILGMHRSGTSLLGNVLQTLGVRLGESLIEGDDNNRAGYFEHAGIVRVHQQLLERLDRRWTGPKGTLIYPAGWWVSSDFQEYKLRLVEIVRLELEQTEGVWGFKDPRTSRLVPLWKEIFRELNISPIYLLALRDPQAVAASVIKRDGISSARAQLLWLVHSLDALRETRGELTCVVEYDRWFTHLHEQAQNVAEVIDLPWPQDDSALLARIAIRPELRHHQTAGEDFLPYVAETYKLLAEAAVTGKLPAKLWQIEAEVYQARMLLQAWSEVIEAMPSERRTQDLVQVSRSGSTLQRVSQAVRARLASQARP